MQFLTTAAADVGHGFKMLFKSAKPEDPSVPVHSTYKELREHLCKWTHQYLH